MNSSMKAQLSTSENKVFIWHLLQINRCVTVDGKIHKTTRFENKQEIKIWTYSSTLHYGIKTLDIQPQFPALSYMYKLSKHQCGTVWPCMPCPDLKKWELLMCQLCVDVCVAVRQEQGGTRGRENEVGGEKEKEGAFRTPLQASEQV